LTEACELLHARTKKSALAQTQRSEIDRIVTAITSNRTFYDGRHIETAFVVMGITCTYHW